MTKQKQEFIVAEEEADLRLDVFLTDKLEVSRSQVQKMIDNELVKVNNKLSKKAGERVKSGSKILILPKDNHSIIQSSNNDEVMIKGLNDYMIDIIAEADDYLVVNKPSGLLVHETEAHEPSTLASWLLAKYPKIKKVGESPERPGIVHRLDKEASGLLVVAKNQKMFDHLKKQFQARTIDKEYTVLVHDVVKKDQDTIDFEIDRGHNGKMVSRPRVNKLSVASVKDIQEGKDALTEIFVEKRFARYTLLRVKIYTGRTNQIRVHMLAHSHPVVGDTLYFNKNLNRKRDLELARVFLHATHLCFNDLAEKKVCFDCGLPSELSNFLKKLN